MRMPPPSPESPFRLWPYLLAYAGVAAWIDLSDIHRFLSCDSIIFVLASLYEWTPFFWEQDRVGLLLPLIASGVRDPFANLLVQNWATIFTGLALPLLFARLVCPHRLAPAVVTAGTATFLLVAPDILHENMLVVCYYPLGLALGAAALIVLDRPGRWVVRVVGAAVLMVLAHWVYIWVCVFLVPLTVCRACVGEGAGRAGRWWRAVAAVATAGVAVAVVYALMEYVRASYPLVGATPADGLPMRDWWRAVENFWVFLAQFPGFWEWIGLVGGTAGIGLVIGLLADRTAVGWTARRVAPLVFAAAAELALLSTRAWPGQNNYHPRYLVAILTAVWVAAVLVGLVPALGAVVRGRRGTAAAGVVAVGLLVAAATARYGWPSPSGVRANLDSRIGWATDTLLNDRCDGIGGEYMTTWPVVFHANMVRYEHGDNRVIVGVSYRSGPWKHRWAGSQYPDGFRLAVVPSEEETAVREANHYGLVPAGPRERRGELLILTLRAKADTHP
jgi:hypothetical protein